VHDTDAEILRTLLRCFDRAMLVSRYGAGLRARPMTLVQTRESKRLWLLCAIAGDRFAELRDDQHVSVVMHDGMRFCSVSGTARVARPARPQNDSPHGRRNPSAAGRTARLALIEVTPQFAEYWDKSSSQGIRFEAAESSAPPRRVADAASGSGRRSAAEAAGGAEPLPLDNVIPFARSIRKWKR
jgi:general stress protein 26